MRLLACFLRRCSLRREREKCVRPQTEGKAIAARFRCPSQLVKCGGQSDIAMEIVMLNLALSFKFFKRLP